MRVVLDTNIFVSMALGGQIGQINDAWKLGKFTLLVSEAILSEYLDVLQRPKLHLNAEMIFALVTRLQRKAEFVMPAEPIDVIEADPSDNMFLEAAVAGEAIYVVSGDSHLLELKSYRGIEILAASEFLTRLK